MKSLAGFLLVLGLLNDLGLLTERQLPVLSGARGVALDLSVLIKSDLISPVSSHPSVFSSVSRLTLRLGCNCYWRWLLMY